VAVEELRASLSVRGVLGGVAAGRFGRYVNSDGGSASRSDGALGSWPMSVGGSRRHDLAPEATTTCASARNRGTCLCR
jgi:hypothetical protein